jgi:hypothetical protein
MISECGPFQWSIPFWRGRSVRIHSRMDEVKCFSTPTGGFDGDVLMSRVLSSIPVGVRQSARKAAATGANFSWNWKTPPWPESG